MQYQRPIYPNAIGKTPGFLLDRLLQRYGQENVVWTVVIGRQGGVNETVAYLFERNATNQVNRPDDNRPVSRSGIPNVFLDYTASERQLSANAPRELEQLLDREFRSSLEFINKGGGRYYFTVDIDVLWRTDKGWRSLEITTFYSLFYSEQRAEFLSTEIHKRTTWKGPAGPIGMRRTVQATEDLGATKYLLMLNSTGGPNHPNQGYLSNGNAYWFPLTQDQITRIVRRQVPIGGQFGTVSQLLEWV